MKKYTKLLLLLLISLVLGFTTPIKAETNSLNWKKENSTWYAYIDSEKLTGWVTDESKCWYFLDYQSGAMQTGWKAGDATHWYYFNPLNGIMQTGWQTIDGNQYYFETTGYYAGAMVTGTVEVAGVLHEFNSNGIYIGKTTGNTSTGNLSESEIKEKQEKIYKETFNVSYIDYFQTDELNSLFRYSFDKTTTDFLPLGTYESKYYEIGKIFSNSYNEILPDILLKDSWDFGYPHRSLGSWKESNPRLVFSFDEYYNKVTMYHLTNDYDMNKNYGPLVNHSDLIYILQLDTGLQVVTDLANKKYCMYNADKTEKYECYDGEEEFNERIITPDEYRQKLFSSKTTTNEYLDEKQEVDAYINVLLNYLN